MNKHHHLKFSDIILGIVGILFLCSFLSTDLNCAKVKNGLFYLYPQKTDKRYVILRKDSVQVEVDMIAKDTSFWKVSWLSECKFNLHYMGGLTFKTQEEKNIYYNSDVEVSILKVTNDYYVHDAVFKMGDIRQSFHDTMWYKKK